MKQLLFLVLFTFLSTLSAQILPETGDSIYYNPKYCNTASTIEDALTSWSFSGNTQDCFNPSEAMLNAIWPQLVVHDTYDCCCKVASTPGLPGAYNGFEGGACEAYLDSLGWSGFEDSLGMNEDMINQWKGIYIDPFGRQYTVPPIGLSIMNKQKYYRFN